MLLLFFCYLYLSPITSQLLLYDNLDSTSGWTTSGETGTESAANAPWCGDRCVRLGWSGSEGSIAKTIINIADYLSFRFEFYMYLKSLQQSGQPTSPADYCRFEYHFDNDAWINPITLTIADAGYTYTPSITNVGGKTSLTIRFRADNIENDENCYVNELYINGTTETPTKYPTSDPTTDPTKDPTADPTVDPTSDPTADPTSDPTSDPTTDPTSDPTTDPTMDPTTDPTSDPTSDPATDPTFDPTLDPTEDPTIDPSISPTNRPTATPTLDQEANEQTTKHGTTATNANMDTEKEATFLETYMMYIIAGGVGLICIVFGCIACYVVQKKRKKQVKNIEEHNVDHMELTQVTTPTTNTNISTADDGEMNNMDIYSNDNALRMWLENIEMMEYYDLFVEQGFNAKISMLYELTDNDLKDIGIKKLADRKAILKQIALSQQNDMYSKEMLNTSNVANGINVSSSDEGDNELFDQKQVPEHITTINSDDSESDEHGDLYKATITKRTTKK